MTCKITFTINKENIKTEVSVSKNKKEARFFANFLGLLQSGEYNDKIVKAIVRDTKANDNIVIGKVIVKSLINAGDILNQPVLLPEELGYKENFDGFEE